MAKESEIDLNSKEFIKKELIAIKDILFEVKKKLDIHEHIEYERELEQLKTEN